MSAPAGTVRVRTQRLAEQAVERARLAVVPKTAGRPPQVPFAVLVALALVGGVAGLLAFNTNMAAASFTATTLQGRVDQLQAKEQHLQMQIDNLQDPQRLAREATRLGMVPISDPAFIRLKDGRVMGDPVVARRGATPRNHPRTVAKPKVLDPTPVYLSPTQPGASGSASNGSGPASGTNAKKPTAHH